MLHLIYIHIKLFHYTYKQTYTQKKYKKLILTIIHCTNTQQQFFQTFCTKSRNTINLLDAVTKCNKKFTQILISYLNRTIIDSSNYNN